MVLSSVHEASSNGIGAGDNLVYTNAGTGAIAPATAVVMTTVPGAAEPVTRQKGRFTLRDIGESSQGYSASASTSSSSSPANGGMRPAGQAQAASALTHGTSATVDPSMNHGGGGSGTATAPAPVAGSVGGLAELQATMLLLIEQNRQLLERVVGMGHPHEAYPGTPTFVSPPGHASFNATSGGERQGNVAVDRLRTVSLSTLTVQATLPPKPPGSTSSERKESPLPREGTPPGWWGSQGQQGQSGQSGPPPRRPTTVGLGRSDMGIGGGGGSTQGGAGGGSGGGSNKGKDDGTGRRGERGRLSALLDQLRDEIEINTAAKKDTDLELKIVS